MPTSSQRTGDESRSGRQSGSRLLSIRARGEGPAGPSSRRRLLTSLILLLSPPLILLADTWIALWRGWTSEARLPDLVVRGSIWWLVLVMLVVVTARGRRFLVGHAPQLALAIGVATVGLLAGELIVREFPRVMGAGFFHSRGPGIRKVFRPDPRWIHGIRGSSLYTTNAQGIRGPELPTDEEIERILCIGGSTTECTYLDDSETWPSLLMQIVNQSPGGQAVWVGNLGISGYSTIEHLELVQHSPLLDTARLLIFQTGVNDFLKVLNGTLEIGPRPLWRRSVLVETALAAYRRSVLTRTFHALEDERGASLEARRAARRRSEGSDRLPDLTSGAREYGQRIASIAAVCRQRQIRCLFLSQPVLWREGLSPAALSSLWLGVNQRGIYLPAEELRRGVDLFNGQLFDRCERLGLQCLSLDTMSGVEAYFYDDCHFTEAGARRVAEMVGDYLLSHSPWTADLTLLEPPA